MNNKLIFITPEDERWYDLKDLPNEEWVNISFCKYCYISNYSRIKTLRYNKKKDCIKILKPWKNIHGYYVIRLTNINTGRRKNYTVSRLMGIIFLNVTSSKQEILHKNFVTKDTCDNRLCNLRVGTHSDNMRDAIEQGRHYTPFREQVGKYNHKSIPVDCYTLDGMFVNTYNSITEARKAIGSKGAHIYESCRNPSITAGGFKWRYHVEKGDI